MEGLTPPQNGDLWTGLTNSPLEVGAIYDWLVRADCGGVVLFSGTVRDFSEGREGVEFLDYEAYEGPASSKLSELGGVLLSDFPGVQRAALLHRLGRMAPGESTVVVGVAGHHRPEAFEAARFGIDTLKSSVPIWKKESWRDGSDWGLGSHELREITQPGTS